MSSKVSPRTECKHCKKSFANQYTRKRHEEKQTCCKKKASTIEEMELNDLPQGPLEHIFSKLTIQDRAHVAATNKHLHIQVQPMMDLSSTHYQTLRQLFTSGAFYFATVRILFDFQEPVSMATWDMPGFYTRVPSRLRSLAANSICLEISFNEDRMTDGRLQVSVHALCSKQIPCSLWKTTNTVPNTYPVRLALFDQTYNEDNLSQPLGRVPTAMEAILRTMSWLATLRSQDRVVLFGIPPVRANGPQWQQSVLHDIFAPILTQHGFHHISMGRTYTSPVTSASIQELPPRAHVTWKVLGPIPIAFFYSLEDNYDIAMQQDVSPEFQQQWNAVTKRPNHIKLNDWYELPRKLSYDLVFEYSGDRGWTITAMNQTERLLLWEQLEDDDPYTLMNIFLRHIRYEVSQDRLRMELDVEPISLADKMMIQLESAMMEDTWQSDTKNYTLISGGGGRKGKKRLSRSRS